MATFTLATYEPCNSFVHGGIDNGELLIMYDYTLDEFYNNSWKSELKFYRKRLLSFTRNREHSLLRNYHKIIQKCQMELVEMYEINNVMYCVLHTYKINILKRKWKNKRYQM